MSADPLQYPENGSDAETAGLNVGTLVAHVELGLCLVLGGDTQHVTVCPCRIERGRVAWVSVQRFAVKAAQLTVIGAGLKVHGHHNKLDATEDNTQVAGVGARDAYRRHGEFSGPRRSRYTGHAGPTRDVRYRDDGLPANDNSRWSDIHDRVAGDVRRDLARHEFGSDLKSQLEARSDRSRLAKELRTAQITRKGELSVTSARELELTADERGGYSETDAVERMPITEGITYTGRLTSLQPRPPSAVKPLTNAERRKRQQRFSRHQRDLYRALGLWLGDAQKDWDRVADLMERPRLTVRQWRIEIANMLGEYELSEPAHRAQPRQCGRFVGCDEESEK